jgi:tRNA pseudouridine 55 synthase
MDGILIINKEKDYTSRDVVNIISKKFNTKKVGHTGTLDPLATGVLVICLGKMTKLVEIITSYSKEYEAEIMLGIETDTGDITGKILKEEKVTKTESEIKEVLDKFVKTYNQEVPIYSAVKVKGRKLYEYARENKEVVLPKKEVTIHTLELIDNVVYENDKTIFKIKCSVSKGTYIRSLIKDISLSLNTIGTMSNLKRTKQGEFLLSDSYTLKQIENDEYNFVDINKIFGKYKKVIVDEYVEGRIKNGSILENRYDETIILFENEKGEKLALYKVYDKDETKIKPYKMLI